MQINILGAGSWGSALAIACSKVANVTIWSHQVEHAQFMCATRNNPNYLPAEISFANNVNFSSDLDQCLSAN